jgi:hypothetical protein
MGSPRKPPSHEPINLDEHVSTCSVEDADVGPPEPVVTGLNDEEDAQRFTYRCASTPISALPAL